MSPKKIDWSQEPFSEILAEWQAVFSVELERRNGPSVPNPGKGGYVVTAFDGHFTSLSQKQEEIFAADLNIYVSIPDLINARERG